MTVTFWHNHCLQKILLAFFIMLSLKTLIAAKEVNYNNLEIKGNDLPQQTFPRQYPPPPFFGGGAGGAGFGNGGGASFGNGGGAGFGGASFGGGGGVGGGCPLCDSSVYSYCSYKILHDSCCCDFPVPHLKPPQCYYNDCSLLYAKSCYEHSLIKNCCCNNPY